jgi:hypothetical protein
MNFIKRCLVPLVLVVVAPLAVCQEPVAVQRIVRHNDGVSSSSYKSPPLSFAELQRNDSAIREAMMTFMRTGDKAAFRDSVFKAAQRGDLAAEILLAEQYIPEQCPSEPDQDVPHCGKGGNEPPPVVFRGNPLGIEASYEEASKWLEKVSAQGSGEASEVLAQLITRMQANGHGTHYIAADSARFHALARSQGFDLEPLWVTCYKRAPGGSGITVGGLTRTVAKGQPSESFKPEELSALKKAGITGSLMYQGGTGPGSSILLTRPEGPAVHVRVILDHDPGSEVLLPMPAHHDVIYVQRGDEFLAFPSVGSVTRRSINLEPQTQTTPQVSVYTQEIDGAYSGGFCAGFLHAGGH